MANISIRQKFIDAISAVQASLVGREDVVQALFLSVLANESAVLLGEPGTAKSATVENVARCFTDATYFSLLFGKYVLPEEVFGPYDVPALKAGYYNRLTEGYLPKAHFAFLDEIFKANGSLLNSLLTLINERKFDNGQRPAPEVGGRVDVPLRTCFGASNEVPEGTDMDALWDRFAVRLWVVGLNQNDDLATALLNLNYPIRTGSRRGAKTVAQLPPGGGITLAELDTAQDEAERLPVAAATIAAVINIKNAVNAAFPGLITDRTLTRVLSLPRAAAWLEGATEVTTSHLECLVNAFWRDPSQRKTVAEAVYAHSNPISEEVRKIVDNLKELSTSAWPKAGLDNGDEDARKAALGVVEEMRTGVQRLGTLVGGSNTAKYTADLRMAQTLLDNCVKQVQAAFVKALGVKVNF